MSTLTKPKQLNRLEILSKIDDLEDNHCKSCTLADNDLTNKHCLTKCEIGSRLMELGNELLNINQEEIKAMLEKGIHLNWTEIESLIEKGVFKKTIAEAMGISRSTLTSRLEEYKAGNREDVTV